MKQTHSDLPSRATLEAHGTILLRNGGNYEEYELNGRRYACGWRCCDFVWITRDLKPQRHK